MAAILFRPLCINSSTVTLDKMAATDNLFRFIFVMEKFCILIKISLKFVPKGLINKNPALV